MVAQASRSWFTRAAALVAGLTLFAGLASTGGAQAEPVQQCPEQEIMPASDIRRGMIGRGLTVVKGREHEEFRAKVLGVLEDGILPGRDMIIIEAKSRTIDDLGGIWFGMSGSPVYVKGELIGAVAFGLSFGPSPIAGLTAAEDMVKVLDLPTGKDPARLTARRSMGKIALPKGMQRRIANRTGASEDQVGRGMRMLKIPFAVSGASDRGLRRLNRVIEREGLPLLPYSAGSSSAAPGTDSPDPLDPGDSFAAALSYGDITAAGIGTTTMVCNGKALAFGHPFFFEGRTLLGANHADTVTIVGDDFFGGGFKLATVAEGVGSVDQDRLAAIRADLGRMPDLIPVTSSVSALNTAQSRDGTTEIVTSRFVPFLAFEHLFLNIDSVFDQISGGSSSVSWTITGTRESGGTWNLSRSNLYVSNFDISIASSGELLGQLFTLLRNKFEKIEFTGVDVDATVDEVVKRYRIKKVRVSRNGGNFVARRRIRVRRGDRVRLRVVLLPFEGRRKIVRLSLRIPRRFRGGTIEVRGGSTGGPGFACFFFGGSCVQQKKVKSFDALVKALENAPHNNDLLARLRNRRGRVKRRDVKVLDQVIRGRKRIRVLMKRR